MLRLALIAFVAPFVTLAALPADPTPSLSKEAYKRAVKAEVAAIQKTLKELAADPEKPRGRDRSSKGIAMMLVRYADALGDDALKSQALKVIQQIDARDWKGANGAAMELDTAKPDADVLKALLPKLTTEETFAPFRKPFTGGLGIATDLAEQSRTVTDTKRVELIAIRSYVAAELAADLPPKLVGSGRVEKVVWDRYILATKNASLEVADEAAKGEKADREKLKKLLAKLNAACANCHPTQDRE
jgi:hypothetical protein